MQQEKICHIGRYMIFSIPSFLKSTNEEWMKRMENMVINKSKFTACCPFIKETQGGVGQKIILSV